MPKKCSGCILDPRGSYTDDICPWFSIRAEKDEYETVQMGFQRAAVH